MDIVTYALLKKKIDGISPSPYSYKGSVETYDNLPIDASTGDMYSVDDTGKSYVWDGEKWNEVSGGIPLTQYVAAGYSSASTYKEGDYVVYNNLFYKAKQDISTAEDWTAAHWQQLYIADDLGSVSGVPLTQYVAAGYSSASTYKEGDYVVYDDLFYKAKQDISTAEEWTAAHWQQIYIADDLGSVKWSDVVADEYDNTYLYKKGDYVIYKDKFYKCKVDMLVPEEWTATNWTNLKVADELIVWEDVIAHEYDATATYSKDDYCVYNNLFYKAKQDISIAEDWTAAHWDVVLIGDELNRKGEIKAIKLAGTEAIPDSEQKVDIPLSTSSQPGLIRPNTEYAVDTNNGSPYALVKTHAQYLLLNTNGFISKGTLENVLDNETVRFDKAMSLTDEQKTQACENIEAVEEDDTITNAQIDALF